MFIPWGRLRAVLSVSAMRSGVAATTGIGRRRALARKEGNPAYLEKREQMVKAAALLFKEKGYEATTLHDIAAAVGADRATMYYYVESKEELLHETVGDVSSRNLKLMKSLLASDLSATDRIRAFIEHTLREYEDSYPQVYVYLQEDMTNVARQKGPVAKQMAKQIREFEAGVVSMLEAGIADGSLRADLDATLVAEALWGMLNWTHRWHKPGGRISAAAIAETFAAVFLDGVAAHK
jgi:AcrR family transcriptional regulator